MTQFLKSLSLVTGESPSPPRDSVFHGSHSNEFRVSKLWIAVHLPKMVSDSLSVLERCSEAEQSTLETLARWVRQFTPSVSLASPQEFLMEVNGSLKLFGGLEAIKKALRAEFERRRITAYLCAAPTARAALWLVRHRSHDVRLPEKLVGSLSVLPLEVTGWPESTQLFLQSMGLQTIGDCLRLPRDGFIQRIGRQYLLQLDQSLGGYDSWLEFRSSQRLSSALDFSDEITDPAVLAHAGGNLIEDLAKVLRKRQIGVESFEIFFHHLHRSATVECIKLASPTQDRERFLRLFLDRLERIFLPAPVIALALRTGRVEVTVEHNATLFRDSAQPEFEEEIDRLIERLRERFGATRIHGISLVEEHRPEAAWAKSVDLLSQTSASAALISPWAHHRPLWILPNPLLLPSTGDNIPRYHGREPLRPKSGPERIETGWWGGENISRDYYMASNNKGEKLWIYQDRRANRNWYLHGIFG